MNTVRSCGCKGVRTCLKCEEDYKIEKPSLQQQLQQLEPWSYCTKCNCLFPGWKSNIQEILKDHERSHNETFGLTLPGIYVKENFLSETEGTKLLSDLDTLQWTNSQSGRRKQNFGPKANFKKRRLQNGSFRGFPEFTKFVQKRFEQIDVLQNFQTIEQCSLEYDPANGASIDPHVDDCWIWGERVVTVNCLGDSVLTLVAYEPIQPDKYNLHLLPQYEDALLIPLLNDKVLEQYRGKVIRVPMPNLSLIVLYGPARYQFEHLILREDIWTRRVCLAYREFTPMYFNGITNSIADSVRYNAQQFWQSNSINVS